jgi:hypothetical protein
MSEQFVVKSRSACKRIADAISNTDPEAGRRYLDSYEVRRQIEQGAALDPKLKYFSTPEGA